MKEFDFEKTPIVEIANEILLDGVKRGASDIHFDPYKDGLVIRMRVDGVLYDYSQVPAAYKRNMISRIKMISSMNIMETRLPQDGAIKSKIGDKTLDLRVSSLPTHNGEKVVLRILDYSKSLQGLETLGFSEHNLKKIIDMIEIPNGIVLVTGATGSGKSTTVYSILQKLNTREVNIITVEDPVEMEVEGLNQVQAQHEIGLDFATVLRSILRQDPDIIMIGEIRDGETARIAVRASITGHKVLSTIHTNNALNTIERLTDMDVERYLIGTSLNGIISQKLARKLCPHCRIARETNDYEKSLFKTVLHKNVDKVYDVNPEGCENCFKGYRNRIAIAEVLVITDAIRTAITVGEPKDVMRKLVYYDGHTHTLLEDGLEKIELGETNFDEIFKLVDLENDLAVAKAFYDEIEADNKKGKKDDTTEDDEAKYKEHNSNIIEISDGETTQEKIDIKKDALLTEDNVDKLEALSADTTLNQDDSDEENLESLIDKKDDNLEILDNTEEDKKDEIKKDDKKDEIETFDEDKKDDNLEILDDKDQLETFDAKEPIEILDDDKKDDELEVFDNTEENKEDEIETFDTKDPIEIFDDDKKDDELEILEDKKDEIETFDEDKKDDSLEVFDDKKDENLEVLDDDKKDEIEALDVLDEKKDDELEVLDEDKQVLDNPIELFDEPKKDRIINYDQMTKVPFVDETLDL